MSLRLSFSVDTDALSAGGFSVRISDGGGTDDIDVPAGVYIHESGVSGATQLASALETALNNSSVLSNTYTVLFNGSTGYEWGAANNTFSIDFSSRGAQGLALRRALGFEGDRGSFSDHLSDMRPWYLILPAIPGRTEYSGLSETPEIVSEAVADDGSRAFMARVTADKLANWKHVAEIETAPTSYDDPGTPVFKDGEDADNVEWSWERMFEHLRTAEHRIAYKEGSLPVESWEATAEGMVFAPQRWSGADFPLWQIPMFCRRKTS